MADVPYAVFYGVLLVGFHIKFFTSPWQAFCIMVCGSLFFPHWDATPVQQCSVVSPPLTRLSLYCVLLLFEVFCRLHVYFGFCLLARRPIIQTRCSRLGRGLYSKCGLCFLVISRQLTHAEVSGRAVWPREGVVKAKHRPPGLTFHPPTHPVLCALTVFVFLLLCPAVLLRCSVLHDGCC